MAGDSAATVLVVDDTPSMLRLHSAMLRHAGYVVHAKESAMEAIGFLEHAVPDVILLDYMMPVMDAPMFLRTIRKDGRLRDVGVILLTASNDEAHIEQAFDAGGNDYLTKPVDRRMLVSRVGALVDAQRTRRRRATAAVRPRSADPLDEARRLKAAQLPRCPVSWGGYTLDGALVAAAEGGGNLFDVIVEPSGDRTIALLDVGGKGAAATMAASRIRSCLRLLVPGRPLDAALADLDKHVSREGGTEVRVALVRVSAERISVANAGLPPVAVETPRWQTRFSGVRSPVGRAEPCVFEVEHVGRDKGLRVTLVTDGATAPFGDADDVEAVCTRLALGGPEHTVSTRLGALFAAPPSDDAAALVLVDTTGGEP